jgi:hypothetical protein
VSGAQFTVALTAEASFWNVIEQGIRKCDAFVLVVSHASAPSWVDREMQFARDQRKRVIGIRIDDFGRASSRLAFIERASWA